MSKTARSHTPARLASEDDSIVINIQGMAMKGLTNTGVPVGPTGSVNRSPARPPRKHSVKARPAVVLEELQSKVHLRLSFTVHHTCFLVPKAYVSTSSLLRISSSFLRLVSSGFAGPWK